MKRYSYSYSHTFFSVTGTCGVSSSSSLLSYATNPLMVKYSYKTSSETRKPNSSINYQEMRLLRLVASETEYRYLQITVRRWMFRKFAGG